MKPMLSVSICGLLIFVVSNLLGQEETRPAVTVKTPEQQAGASQVVPLWPDGPPNDNGLSGPENVGGCIGNISDATLSVFLPPTELANGAAVVITPGGGYGVVCVNTEGKDIAKLLTPKGVAAIVVQYRLPNQHHLIPANDARRAIRTVRHNAEKWNIDPMKVGVWGFSAGGHLASTVSTKFDEGKADEEDIIERQNSRPDFSILFYPVISMQHGVTHGGSRNNLLGGDPSDEMVLRYSNELQVSKDTPPTFLLHAADDKVVPVENCLRYYQALLKSNVQSRMVVFETGGHGPGAFKTNPSWAVVFDNWLSKQIANRQ